MRQHLRATLVVTLALLAACEQSDEDLCEEARRKLVECGSNSFQCPENLADEVREQYECIVDAECNEIADCAD